MKKDEKVTIIKKAEIIGVQERKPPAYRSRLEKARVDAQTDLIDSQRKFGEAVKDYKIAEEEFKDIDVILETDRKRRKKELTQEDRDLAKAANDLATEERKKKNEELTDDIEALNLQAQKVEAEARLKAAQEGITGKSKNKNPSRNDRVIKDISDKRELARRLDEEMRKELEAIENQAFGRIARTGVDVNATGFDILEHFTEEEAREYENIKDHYLQAKAQYC